MTYADKLKDPRWQKKRLEKLESEAFTCELCGDTTEELHVHHKHYIKGKSPWQYENESLVVMCKTCHGEFHSERDILDKLLGEVIQLHDMRRVCGYLLGIAGGDIFPSQTKKDPQIWDGLADYFRTSPHVISNVEDSHDGSQSPLDLPVVLWEQSL